MQIQPWNYISVHLADGRADVVHLFYYVRFLVVVSNVITQRKYVPLSGSSSTVWECWAEIMYLGKRWIVLMLISRGV